MKFNLSLAYIALMLFTADVSARKEPPPGAGPNASVPANILLALDLSASMNKYVPGPYAPDDPLDIAIDSKGNWHLQNKPNWYHPPGPISQFSPEPVYIKSFGAPHARASFDKPKIVFDSLDNVYLTDTSDSLIHVFDSTGAFTKSIPVAFPLAIDVDTKGNIYVAGSEKKWSPPWTLKKFDSAGTMIKEWSLGDKDYDYPYGVSFYDDQIFVVSNNPVNNSHPGGTGCKSGYPVRVINADADNDHQPGPLSLTDDLPEDETEGDPPEEWDWIALGAQDIEITAKGIYVLAAEKAGSSPDYCGGQIGKYTHEGVFQKRFAPWPQGSLAAMLPEEIWSPRGLGSDAEGNIYVTGGRYIENTKALKFDPDGELLAGLFPLKTRLEAMLAGIKSFLRIPALTDKVNYGLLLWSKEARMRMKISPDGARAIMEGSCSTSICGSKSFTYDFLFGDPGMGGTNLKAGMELAEKYFKNTATGFTPGPIDPAKPCQKNFIMVISDAEDFNSEELPIVRSLLDELNIKTMVVGFALAPRANQTAYNDLSIAGGTFPYSPVFAGNVLQLVDTIKFLISKTQQSDLTYTGTVPTIASSSGDYIYQSTFTVPESGQWRGRLTKYTLNAETGSIGDVVWEAGSKLNDKPAGSRIIWTVAPFVASGMNNFVDENFRELARSLYEGSSVPSDEEIKKLIRFVRGLDAYDEDVDSQVNDEREWKLADIYHSEMAVVGPPSMPDPKKIEDTNSEAYYKHITNYKAFVDAKVNRTPVVYAGANSGLLHAFYDSSGEELWAFIPPNLVANLREMTTSVANTTVPIYGVDGSPVVKDIYLGGQWRTVLMAGLGRERYGYFALDVTTPEDPKFLFAFRNDPVNGVIRHWGPDGLETQKNHSSVSAEFNYSKLGEAWSTPTIISLPDGLSRQWVAVIGGGKSESAGYGSAEYVIDLENDGKVLKLTELTDTAGGFINSVPAQVTAITPDTTSAATYKGALAYFTDIESKLSKVNLSDSGTVHGITELFDGEGNTVNQRASFMPVTASTDSDDKVWIYFGTGNQDRLQLSLSTIQNRIFGIKEKRFPGFSSVGKSTISNLNNVTDEGATCPAEEDLGWYVNLGRDEKVTNKLAIHNSVLFAPLYTPDTTQLCFPGTSALSELGFECGKVLRRTELGSGIVTGARIFRDKVYAGISGTPGSRVEVGLGDGFTKKGNLVSGTPASSSDSSSSGVVLESWRERF